MNLAVSNIAWAPHDRLAAYALLGADGAVSLHRLDYDAAAARAAMEAVGLTQGYHAALTTGWWPSEDCLPKTMRRQGADWRKTAAAAGE